jgi:hypothetical protein
MGIERGKWQRQSGERSIELPASRSSDTATACVPDKTARLRSERLAKEAADRSGPRKVCLSDFRSCSMPIAQSVTVAWSGVAVRRLAWLF